MQVVHNGCTIRVPFAPKIHRKRVLTWVPSFWAIPTWPNKCPVCCSSWRVKSLSDFQSMKASYPPLHPPQKYFKQPVTWEREDPQGQEKQLLQCRAQIGYRTERVTFLVGDPPMHLSRVLRNPKTQTQLTAETWSQLPPPTHVPASLMFPQQMAARCFVPRSSTCSNQSEGAKRGRGERFTEAAFMGPLSWTDYKSL